MDALVAVRRRIAQALVGAPAPESAALGDVVLRPHQTEAVRRLRDALRTHGGALLADAPGLGKTYVALALARDYGGAVVVAPAALRAQWMRSAARANVRIAWCSLEALSRRPLALAVPLVVIDEAHHLRNPATRRYANASTLAVGKCVLLLSATPVHNRSADRDALLALFLGAAAATLPSAVLADIIVRREADARLLPRRHAARWLAAPRAPGFSASLRALPPALPTADGREAAMLVRLTLAHAWSSSLAALDDALRRAILRARAIDDALALGRWPTRRELRTWVTSAESSQLAFPEVAAAPASGDCAVARATLARYVSALSAVRATAAAARDTDSLARAVLLRRVIRRHPGATIVAFSRYAGTIDALWRELRFEPGVVAITARGVRTAGGRLRRRDVLDALGGTAAQDPRMPLRLVLSTDLLGEGLDLRAASVIVHLDQPWTPALLDQREGRAARLASPHASVSTYALRPPRGAEVLLAMKERLRAKRAVMGAATDAGTAREALLALVRPWLDAPPSGARVAAGTADRDGWMAVVRDARGQERVLARGFDGAILPEDADLLAVLRSVGGAHLAPMCTVRLRAARRELARWLRSDASAALARVHHGTTPARAALSRRFDEGLRSMPFHQRVALQPRIIAARRRLAAAQGDGVERAMASAARLLTVDSLLEAVERIATRVHSGRLPRDRSKVLALLLLMATPP